MNNRYSKFFFSIFLALLSISQISAQKNKKDGIEYSGFFDSYYFRGPLNITLGGGLTSFNGDVCKFMQCSPSYYASLGVSYQVWPRTYFGAELSYVNLTGARNDNLNYGFTNSIFQFEAFGRFLLLDKKVTRHSQLKDKPYLIRPYIYGGIGYFHNAMSTITVNPDLPFFAGDTARFAYPKNGFEVPVGIGFQIWFSHRFSIMPEFIYHFALTDQLDGIQLNSDASTMDSYATIGLKIQITPTAPRVRKKKKKLTPPDEYTGPKGTDYPRKREEPKKKTYGTYQDYGDDDQGGDFGEDNYDNGENPDDGETPQEDNSGDQPQQSNDDWGW
jgi:hypothetical protein